MKFLQIFFNRTTLLNILAFLCFNHCSDNKEELYLIYYKNLIQLKLQSQVIFIEYLKDNLCYINKLIEDLKVEKEKISSINKHDLKNDKFNKKIAEKYNEIRSFILNDSYVLQKNQNYLLNYSMNIYLSSTKPVYKLLLKYFDSCKNEYLNECNKIKNSYENLTIITKNLK